MPVVGKSVENLHPEPEAVNSTNKSNKNKPTAPPRTKEKNGIFRSSKSSGNLDPSSNNSQSSRPLTRPTRYIGNGLGTSPKMKVPTYNKQEHFLLFRIVVCLFERFQGPVCLLCRQKGQ